MTSFVLRCTICPNRPDFSDLSHLLTHVGSKGHLSHYFRAQVRSRQEGSVREQLRIYDLWYEKNQLEKLLAQRMILKESKNANDKIKANSKTRQYGSSGTPDKSFKESKHRDHSARPKMPENVLDPQLTQDLPVTGRPFSGDRKLNLPEQIPGGKASLPKMQNRAAVTQGKQEMSLALTPAKQLESVTFIPLDLAPRRSLADLGPLLESPVQAEYPEPPLFRDPSLSYETGSWSSVRENSAGAASTGDIDVEDGEAGYLEESNECTKLKGVCWPGMNIFDSASPSSRRKRNQKKDGSTLKQMKANSATVEPTELIFYRGGELKKKRYISGQVESSPLKEDTPKPKRQRPRPKKAPLSDGCGNTSRFARRGSTIKTAFKEVKSDLDTQRLSTHGLSWGKSSAFEDIKMKQSETAIHDDDEVEWQLMMGGLKRGIREGFNIYHEEPVEVLVNTQSRPTDRFCNPNRELLQDRCTTKQIRPILHGLPDLEPGATRPPPTADFAVLHRPLAPGANLSGFYSSHKDRASSRATDNKENLEPILDQAGRIDSAAALGDPGRSTQRYFAMQGSDCPRYFSSMPSHWGYTSLQMSPSCGFSMNPLAFTFGQSTSTPFLQSQLPPRKVLSPGRKPAFCASSERNPDLSRRSDSDDETIDAEDHQQSMLLFGQEASPQHSEFCE
ncbi:hypothetical protein MMC19_002672 [Ptychographa xylographoides]|nr:hypothetical protein [Ptychographa xylographoides]